MFKGVRISDVVLAIFLVAITGMLLVPLPTVVLDFLLVINLAVAVLVLLAGLYMPGALALLSFPSLLLLLTLFRLGLNVASTRLILSQGDAGQVIQSFGSFLIRGEVLVGIIIFLIITIVNFIVIARGSSRVSEVAARFALDALPGKQLAIDSDLRSGLLSADEARRRRDDLRKESQLYGSMDGAMKFVQGDAIAGLFIIAVNMLGGIFIGVRNGLGFPQAVQTYTTLTVGDGLVNQIPAILVSICAGIVVTRVSSSEKASLGSDVQAQLFRNPGSTMAAGGLMVLIGVVPGLPLLPFSMIGLFLIGSGLLQKRSMTKYGLALGYSTDPDAAHSRGGEDDEIVSPCLVSLDKGLYGLFVENSGGFLEWWQTLSRDVFDSTGLRLPSVRVVHDADLGWYNYSVMHAGAVIDSGQLFEGCLLFETTRSSALALGLEPVSETAHPVSANSIVWVKKTDSVRKISTAAGIRVLGPIEYIGLKCAAFVRRCPEEFLPVSSVMAMEASLEKKYPGILSQSVNRQFMNSPRLSEVLQELIREGLSVRDVRQVIEAVTSYCSTTGASLVQEGEFDLHDVVSHVRLSKRRQLLNMSLGGRNTLKAVTLSREVEDLVEQLPAPSVSNNREIQSAHNEALKKSISEILNVHYLAGVGRIGVICRPDLRSRVVKLLFALGLHVPVITTEEISGDIALEPVGIWKME